MGEDFNSLDRKKDDEYPFKKGFIGKIILALFGIVIYTSQGVNSYLVEGPIQLSACKVLKSLV